jgi:hypothetical protein
MNPESALSGTSGERVTIRDQIADIMNYASACGANLNRIRRHSLFLYSISHGSVVIESIRHNSMHLKNEISNRR